MIQGLLIYVSNLLPLSLCAPYLFALWTPHHLFRAALSCMVQVVQRENCLL